MTESQFLNKIDKLSNKTASHMRMKARKLLGSGTIKLGDWKNDYQFPKIVTTALCKEAVWQWQPLSRADRKEVSNIERMI